MMGLEALWQALITVGLGLIGYLLRDLKSSIDEKLKDQKNELRELEKDFANLRVELPSNYVTREDFLRAISTLDTRIELEFKDFAREFREFLKEERRISSAKTYGDTK